MHEFSICDALVRAIGEELDKLDGPVRLKAARVVVGQMRQIVPQNLEAAYQVLTRGTRAEGSALTIVEVPAEGRCAACGWSGPIEDMFFICGACGATEIELTRGMELHLDNLEVTMDE
jgi:hydrogenase nickel incorporation protein HypA/HybF